MVGKNISNVRIVIGVFPRVHSMKLETVTNLIPNQKDAEPMINMKVGDVKVVNV